MAKDPAFLFYSKDYYEGTRMMLPEERACYIDLLVYQHQNGHIPNDLKRVQMYCGGIDKETLENTLKAKFTLCDTGWYNEKLERVINERKEFSEKQSINGTVGNFFKKAKTILSKKDYTLIQELFENQTNEQKYQKIKDIEINEANLIAMLNAKRDAMRTHLVDANEDEDVIENKDLNTTNYRMDDFEKFWEKMPNKVSKKKCLDKWKKLNDEQIDKILSTVDAWIAYKPFDTYTHPHPLTYLNQERWNDELPTIKTEDNGTDKYAGSRRVELRPA